MAEVDSNNLIERSLKEMHALQNKFENKILNQFFFILYIHNLN